MVEEFNSDVPKNVKDLQKLAGVGLKTANVFLNDLYQANEGIGVDTHVMRVAQRLGLTKEEKADGVEGDLQGIYDQKDWYRVNKAFVLYGRYVCRANVKPSESECVFDFCAYCKNL